jgi:hypothetical protein
MKNFKILHPVGGALNTNMERGLYEFEYICSIDALDINKAFILAQNDWSERYASLDKRSTSVGDIIIDTDELIHYMVAGRGFIEIPPTVAQYIDWGNHMEDLKNECELNSLENQSNEQ